MKRIFNCTGFKVPLPGRWQLEFWWCPKGTEIPRHVHMECKSFIWMLAGRMKWRVGNQEREVRGPFRRRRSNRRLALSAYRVDPRMPHGAVVTGLFGFFLNLERWNGPKTSAASDIEMA